MGSMSCAGSENRAAAISLTPMNLCGDGCQHTSRERGCYRMLGLDVDAAYFFKMLNSVLNFDWSSEFLSMAALGTDSVGVGVPGLESVLEFLVPMDSAGDCMFSD